MNLAFNHKLFKQIFWICLLSFGFSAGMGVVEVQAQEPPKTNDATHEGPFLTVPAAPDVRPIQVSGNEHHLVIYNPRTGEETIVVPPENRSQATHGLTRGSPGLAGTLSSESQRTTLTFDTLSKIDRPDLYPWRVNAKLYMRYPGQAATYVCSGTFIDPYHVLTAGTCVYAQSFGWADTIRVVPGFDNGFEPYGDGLAVSEIYSWSGWTDNANFDWNMGYIKLDRPVGALVGWHGYGFDDDDDFFRNNFNNAGYPIFAPYQSGSLYQWFGFFDDVFTHRVAHNRPSDDGMLGSSAYYFENNSPDRIAYSVHSYTSTANEAYYTRINGDRFNSIQARINANTPSTPDLIPLDVNASPQLMTAGEKLSSMDFYLHNYSSATWNNSVSIDLYLSDNDLISEFDTLLSSTSYVGTIGSKQSRRINVTVPPTIPPTAEGTYWLGLILTTPDADSGNNATIEWDAVPISVIRSVEEDVRPIDLTISLYRTASTAVEQAPYERILENFADAIYEMTNGSHKVRNVTIYQNGEMADQADVLWNASEWPRASVSAFGRNGQLFMADEFPFDAPFDALDTNNWCGAGYTLGHEWGHYYYGLFDEYDIPDDSFDDDPVQNSVMSSQWRACNAIPDWNWLNFSIAANNTEKNEQHRAYEASGWETLSRSPKNDPRNGYRSGRYPRHYYPELRDVAPNGGNLPSIELPTEQAAARTQLDVTWMSINRVAGRLQGNYRAAVESVSGDTISYPAPAVLVAKVTREDVMTGVDLEATLTAPDGMTATIRMQDNGLAPDLVAEDGFYTGIMPYQQEGVHDVTILFTNSRGDAWITQDAYHHTPGPNGEYYVSKPIPVSEPFTVTANAPILITDFDPDDHGSGPTSATLLSTDNIDIDGRIDTPSDRDLFRIDTNSAGELTLRVSNFTAGMKPRIRLLDTDATTVREEFTYTPTQSAYFFTPLTLAANETVYIEVSNANPSDQPEYYSISVGPAIDSGQEVAGQIRFSQAAYRVNEQDRMATITVERVLSAQRDVSVSYTTIQGSAQAKSDYVPVSGTLVFSTNVTVQTFAIPLVNDNIVEDDKTFTLLLGDPQGGISLSNPFSATVTIVNDDEPARGNLRFSKTTYEVNEAPEIVTIAVERVNGIAGTISVDYRTNDVTAIAGEDYAKAQGTLTFVEGELTQSFTITLIDDDTVESDEVVSLILENPAGGAQLGGINIANLVIKNDDQPPAGNLRFDQEAYVVQEEDDSIDITIRRVNGTFGEVTVDYATANGTATAGDDFVQAAGMLIFADGENEQTISIKLLDDTLKETAETLAIVLSNPTGSSTVVGQGAAIVTIQASDQTHQTFLPILMR